MTSPRSGFRPCIDLHDGIVKQIVGGSLSESDSSTLKTNFVSSDSPSHYARLYKENNLIGGHVIKLGPGNDDAAKEALAAWPGGLQLGGGINDKNALEWLHHGAEKIIVTSFLFPSSRFSLERLKNLSLLVGKDRLVVDVSCRRKDDRWYVAMNKWQDLTDMEVNQESLDLLSQYCSEFLVHAADVEGLCQGIDEEMVKKLGEWVRIPTTYAGGAKDISDLDLVNRLSNGKVDLTYGSALDIFGGTLVKFSDLVARSIQ
ncbi:Phosphoribosylformimino-5-aminoimidazole carboxamide ribotide isomerase [Hysterangium stoloniferum]|nr:Phosphoribosylformimino-5-aminoimidazole carboxamide ribotide isomerase [Hysterangium stoloniferum]